MTRTVVFLLPSLSRRPVSGSFKQSIAESFAQPTCSLNSRCRCLMIRRPSLYPVPHPCTICNVSKSGSALHAFTNSEVAERTLPTGSRRYPVSVTSAISGTGQIAVSSVSFGHKATNPEDGGSESSPASSDPKVSNHLRDGLAHESRGIANRLTFESRLDARELRIESEGIFAFLCLGTQTKSSTP